MTDLQGQFDTFIERISLGKTQLDRIESAFTGLQEYLCEAYGVSASEVFKQGSVPNGTAVKPVPGGEYDLDIFLVVPNAEHLDADKALSNLMDVLNVHGRYKGKCNPKKPCVRIEYADEEIGGFHIDVVPGRASSKGEAPLQAPRRGGGWHGTAPREYTQWCLDQGEGFSRTVKALKRWRDEHQDVRSAIKSIVLQVLVGGCIPPTTADGPGLATTLTELHALLARQTGPPAVWNPVLPSENLAASWSQEAFNDFRQEVASAQAKAVRAVQTEDDAEAAALWVEILGDDFPLVDTASAGLALGDFSHARTPADEGWREVLMPGARIAISAQVFSEGARRLIIENFRGHHVLLSGWTVRFTAHVNGSSSGRVWWQVVNTGGHARSSNGLRGAFFKARDRSQQTSTDERTNWESTSYTGAHWIEAFLVEGSTVVARSGHLYVPIKNSRHRFLR